MLWIIAGVVLVLFVWYYRKKKAVPLKIEKASELATAGLQLQLEQIRIDQEDDANSSVEKEVTKPAALGYIYGFICGVLHGISLSDHYLVDVYDEVCYRAFKPEIGAVVDGKLESVIYSGEFENDTHFQAGFIVGDEDATGYVKKGNLPVKLIHFARREMGFKGYA